MHFHERWNICQTGSYCSNVTFPKVNKYVFKRYVKQLTIFCVDCAYVWVCVWCDYVFYGCLLFSFCNTVLFDKVLLFVNVSVVVLVSKIRCFFSLFSTVKQAPKQSFVRTFLPIGCSGIFRSVRYALSVTVRSRWWNKVFGVALRKYDAKKETITHLNESFVMH